MLAYISLIFLNKNVIFNECKRKHETGRRGSKFTFDRLPGTRFSRLSSWRRQIGVLKKVNFTKIEKVHETGRRGSKFAFDQLPGTRFSR